MTDLVALRAANAKRWADSSFTRRTEFVEVAPKLVSPYAKARYQRVSSTLASRGCVVPWYFIAVVHEREASQRWDTHLGQGDPLSQITRHVPAGEPAFATWEEGAIDALVNCPPYAARNKDWSVGGFLTMTELYNGLGYAYHNRPSPYVWSGMSCYTTGKIKVDHGPIVEEADKQLGTAGLIKAMMALDPTITFTGIVLIPGDTKPAPTDLRDKDNKPNVGPVSPAPSFATAFASIVSAIFSLFKRK